MEFPYKNLEFLVEQLVDLCFFGIISEKPDVFFCWGQTGLDIDASHCPG